MYRFVQLLCQLFLAYVYIKNVYYDPVEIWDTSSHLVWILNDWQNLKLLVLDKSDCKISVFNKVTSKSVERNLQAATCFLRVQMLQSSNMFCLSQLHRHYLMIGNNFYTQFFIPAALLPLNIILEYFISLTG